jgi:hypothetical protein
VGVNRNKICYEVIRALVSGAVGAYHNIDINGVKNISREGPALLLSKHQSIKDVFIQGRVLGGYVGRPGNWVMKSSLPKCFEKLGGLRIIRPQEVAASAEGLSTQDARKARRASIAEARKYRDEVKIAMRDIYNQGELLVLHPEGHRYPYEMGEINMPLINYTKQLQEFVGDISLVLMGIDYENINGFGSKVAVNIDRLDWDVPDLERVIGSEIGRLSGLD